MLRSYTRARRRSNMFPLKGGLGSPSWSERGEVAVVREVQGIVPADVAEMIDGGGIGRQHGPRDTIRGPVGGVGEHAAGGGTGVGRFGVDPSARHDVEVAAGGKQQIRPRAPPPNRLAGRAPGVGSEGAEP